jgi:hypothetical protein
MVGAHQTPYCVQRIQHDADGAEGLGANAFLGRGPNMSENPSTYPAQYQPISPLLMLRMLQGKATWITSAIY